MFDNCRWAVVRTPALDHLAHFLVTHVQRAVLWTRCLHVLVRVPQFHRSIEVANTMVTTPFNNGWAINVPRKVDKNVTVANASAQKCIKVVASNAILFISHSHCQNIGNTVAIVANVNNGDGFWIKFQIANHQWNRALRNRSTAEHQGAFWMLECYGSWCVHFDAIGDIWSPASIALNKVSSEASNTVSEGISNCCQSYAIPLRPVKVGSGLVCRFSRNDSSDLKLSIGMSTSLGSLNTEF